MKSRAVKIHLSEAGAGARCGRGAWPGRPIETSTSLDEVTCEQCRNLATVGTWSPTRKRAS